MNKKYYLPTLKPADRLVLPKSKMGLIQHHAVYIGKDKNGNRMYIENAIGRGVQIVSEAYLFRDGYKLTRVEPFTGNQYQRNAAIKLATQLIGKNYDLLLFNCEHYANTVQHNRSYSYQVSNGLILGFLALLLGVGISK